MRKLTVFRLVGAIALIGAGATPAWAGFESHGYGDTKMEAMADANRNAEKDARENGTCVTTRATPQSCVQNNGLWDCYAIVANHQGSC